MNFEKFISKKELLIKNDLQDQHHVALCFDRNYAMPAGILISSIIANNSHLNFHFHLFALSIDDDHKQRFKKIDGKAEITLYYVDSAFNDIKYASKKGYYPISTCIRLIVPSILKNITDRVIYLDSDMLCTGNFQKLFEIDIKDYIVACVLEIDGFIKRHAKTIGLNNNYFNSGMLYINTKKWCEEKITEKTINLISENFYEYPDQDALNIAVNDKNLIIKNVFNYLVRISVDGKIDYHFGEKKLNEVIFFHFLGPFKPWFKIYMKEMYKYYFMKSPWSNKEIKFAPDPSTVRIFSKNLMKKKEYISSLKYYLIYLLSKLKILN